MSTQSKKRYFFYSDHAIKLQEIRFLRLKIAGIISLGYAVILLLVFIVNHLMNDFLGIGYQELKLLRKENALYKEQLKNITAELRNLQLVLDELYQSGNNLRLMVDLPILDEDIKKAAVGGEISTNDFEIATSDLDQMFQNANSMIENLRNQINLQSQNYSEILKKYKYNKEFFASIPALKPMEGYYSPQGFGDRRHPILGIYKAHGGLDIINDVGTPVYATGDGVVEMAGRGSGGYGLTIIINHGFGYQTLYAHLSKILVNEGKRVKRGELIAKSGRSGLVSGPHLHYEVHYKGVRQNPVDYFFDEIRPDEYLAQLKKVKGLQ